MRSPYEDTFVSWSVPGRLADQLWAGAWWFLGTTFFRQSVILWQGRPAQLLHLRVDLAGFEPDARLRRVRRRNRDLVAHARTPVLDETRRRLFDRHKTRFTEGVPDSMDDFLGPAPGLHPVPGVEFDVYADGNLIAVSYLALGETAVASLYGVFDPAYSRRSLGWFTLLLELEYARRQGYRYYYPGYALADASRMDYKKRLPALEAYAWNRGWHPYRPGGFEVPAGGEEADSAG